jgi:hypothetical protein
MKPYRAVIGLRISLTALLFIMTGSHFLTANAQTRRQIPKQLIDQFFTDLLTPEILRVALPEEIALWRKRLRCAPRDLNRDGI